MKPAYSNRYGLLYQADCLDALATIQDDSLHCIFADPPFNLGKVYGHGQLNDALARQDYLEWSGGSLDECVRVLRPGGALFVYIIPQWGYHFAAHLDEKGMLFRHWIALSMKGTFPRGRKLYPAHYAMLYFTKGRPGHLQPGAASDSDVPPLREGREGLWRAPEVPQSARLECHRLLGRHGAGPPPQVQDPAGTSTS